jgi:predicted transcriptional regulator
MDGAYMPGDRDHLSDDALADIAYLARSSNRVEILGAIVSQPRSPRELVETTGSARSTLERILTELEERGWVERTSEGEYVSTDAGKFVIDEFTPVVEAMEAIRNLGETLSWLPRDKLSISLSHFSDAIVRRPDDPAEAIDYMTEVIRDTENFRVISHLIPPEPPAKAIHDGVKTGRLDFEYVLTEDVIEFLSDHSERRERWGQTVDAGADLWAWAGPIPCNLWIFDETVWIKKSRPGSIQDTYAVPIISDDDTVRAWSHDLIDSYRDAATAVDSEAFRENAPVPPTESKEGT